jgi:hypothetical protein
MNVTRIMPLGNAAEQVLSSRSRQNPALVGHAVILVEISATNHLESLFLDALVALVIVHGGYPVFDRLPVCAKELIPDVASILHIP